MMYAQYIAAQAFNSGGLGIIHSISHAISAFYDTHHGLNNAIALPRVWAFNMSAAYKRFADIAQAMGVDTYGITDVQAAEAGLAAAIRLLRDVNIIEKFTDVKQDSYFKNRLGQGPTKFYENAPVIKGGLRSTVQHLGRPGRPPSDAGICRNALRDRMETHTGGRPDRPAVQGRGRLPIRSSHAALRGRIRSVEHRRCGVRDGVHPATRRQSTHRAAS